MRKRKAFYSSSQSILDYAITDFNQPKEITSTVDEIFRCQDISNLVLEYLLKPQCVAFWIQNRQFWDQLLSDMVLAWCISDVVAEELLLFSMADFYGDCQPMCLVSLKIHSNGKQYFRVNSLKMNTLEFFSALEARWLFRGRLQDRLLLERSAVDSALCFKTYEGCTGLQTAEKEFVPWLLDWCTKLKVCIAVPLSSSFILSSYESHCTHGRIMLARTNLLLAHGVIESVYRQIGVFKEENQ